MTGNRLLAPIDQRQVWRQFAKAAKKGVASGIAGGIDDPLALEIGQRMLERLDYVRIEPEWILDLGAGTGHSSQALQNRYPAAKLILLDAVSELLPAPTHTSSWKNWLGRYFSSRIQKTASPQSIAGDARRLPLKPSSLDLIWSNMLLPWVDDISSVFSESHLTLKTGGLFMFSTLGPDTLKSLESCFSGATPHSHTFPDMHDLGDLLGHTGFADPVVDMEIITVEYSTLSSLLDDLRKAGAGCAHTQRSKGLTGQLAWQHVESQWKTLANNTENPKVPIRFEIIYGHAWKTTPKKIADGREIIQIHPKLMRSP
ncbi:MAG: malonyl-ACP O-methyltransferase BioC [Pseudomonadota bacterium]|jgi:malonyl-CoA O-methyltransferase